MNREKQIEEMANDYYEAVLKARETLGSMNNGAPKWFAKELYAKGYRKATDVAREIFEDLEPYMDWLDGGGNVILTQHEFDELKKKYTEGGNNG